MRPQSGLWPVIADVSGIAALWALGMVVIAAVAGELRVASVFCAMTVVCALLRGWASREARS